MVLKLDGTALQNTSGDTYALAITVTNSLGQSSSAVTQFTVAEAGASPSISVFAPGSDASGSVSVQPSRGLKLYSKLQIDSVCKGVATKVCRDKRLTHSTAHVVSVVTSEFASSHWTATCHMVTSFVCIGRTERLDNAVYCRCSYPAAIAL